MKIGLKQLRKIISESMIDHIFKVVIRLTDEPKNSWHTLYTGTKDACEDAMHKYRMSTFILENDVNQRCKIVPYKFKTVGTCVCKFDLIVDQDGSKYYVINADKWNIPVEFRMYGMSYDEARDNGLKLNAEYFWLDESYDAVSAQITICDKGFKKFHFVGAIESEGMR